MASLIVYSMFTTSQTYLWNIVSDFYFIKNKQMKIAWTNKNGF